MIQKAKYLDSEGVRKFLAAIEKASATTPVQRFIKIRDMALFDLMYVLGLRITEACMLRLEMLQLEKGQIFVERLKRRKPWGRWHDLDAQSIGLLRKWLKERAKRASNSSGYLFTGLKTRHDKLTSVEVWYRFKHYAKAAGIENRSPHSLRHACAIALAQRGKNAFDIMSHLGHANVQSSQEYVQMVGPERKEQDRRANESLREFSR